MSRALRAAGLLIGLLAASCHKDALDPMGPGGVGIVTGRAGGSGAAGAQGAGAAQGTGGALGSAGSSGSAGDGALGGAGGARCSLNGVSYPAPGNCGPAACGNHTRDSCIWASPCGGMTITEACDDDDLGAWTCAALGYASGTPTCSATCEIEGWSCSECATGDSPNVLCGDAPTGANPWTIRLAATNDEIGLLWLTPGVGQSGATLSFARLAPDLRLLSETALEGQNVLATVGTSRDFGVAPAPSGWIVVGWGTDGIFIHAVDRNGEDHRRTLIGSWGGSLAEGPMIVPRPDGPPLIAWVSGTYPGDGGMLGVLHVAAVGADGLSVGPVHDLSADDWTRPHGLAFAGDAFYAALVAGSPANPGQTRVQRIEADGTPTTVIDALPGVHATSVVPFGCGSDLCLTYDARLPAATRDTDTGFQWTKIDASGAAVDNIAILTFASDRAYKWAIPTTIGRDVVTVLGGAPDDTVGVARSELNGLPLTLTSTITRYGGQSSYVPAVAVRGTDLLVAWGPAPRGHIRIARVSF